MLYQYPLPTPSPSNKIAPRTDHKKIHPTSPLACPRSAQNHHHNNTSPQIPKSKCSELDCSPTPRPLCRSFSNLCRRLSPSQSPDTPRKTYPNPCILLTPLLRRKFFSFTAEDLKQRPRQARASDAGVTSTNSNSNSSNGRIPPRSRTGPSAKSHSSTSSISSTSSTPSSDDSLSIASIDTQLPVSTSSSSSSSSSTASGSTSLSMSTTSSSTDAASQDSSTLSVDSSPSKSSRVIWYCFNFIFILWLKKKSLALLPVTECIYWFPAIFYTNMVDTIKLKK